MFYTAIQVRNILTARLWIKIISNSTNFNMYIIFKINSVKQICQNYKKKCKVRNSSLKEKKKSHIFYTFFRLRLVFSDSFEESFYFFHYFTLKDSMKCTGNSTYLSNKQKLACLNIEFLYLLLKNDTVLRKNILE